MARRRFHLLLIAFTALFMLLNASCENNDYTEEELNVKENPGKTGGSDSDSSDDDDEDYYDDDDNGGSSSHQKHDTLTVAEFINGNFEGGAFVKGYVVGDCTKSFKYAEFEPPFTNPQAILLADDKDERDKDYLLAVQLKSGSKARTYMNLVDNPWWYGKQVVLYGYRATYLGMAGLKDIGSYPLYRP